MSAHPAAVRALYEPQATQLVNLLPDVAVGLHAQLCAFSAAPSIDGAERLAANLSGAQRHVLRIRESLIREGGGDGA